MTHEQIRKAGERDNRFSEAEMLISIAREHSWSACNVMRSDGGGASALSEAGGMVPTWTRSLISPNRRHQKKPSSPTTASATTGTAHVLSAT